MDVVYNHVSQYDYNPLKYIDKFYYFHTDPAGKFLHTSGCGNDFYTSRPMARRLIVESVLYWMNEYHIDGFRFDLATMIDWETCKQITEEAKKINPNVMLIAEAWGGGKYDPSQRRQGAKPARRARLYFRKVPGKELEDFGDELSYGDAP
jgi:pullulanase/glycogen debranching enzyme